MDKLSTLAAANQQRAQEVIRDSGIKASGVPWAPNRIWSARSARDC